MTEGERDSYDLFYCDLKITKDRIIECDLDGNEIENQDSYEYKVKGNKIIFVNLPGLTSQNSDITFDGKRVTIVNGFTLNEIETTVTTVYVRK